MSEMEVQISEFSKFKIDVKRNLQRSRTCLISLKLIFYGLYISRWIQIEKKQDLNNKNSRPIQHAKTFYFEIQ